MAMELILLEDVDTLGKIGDTIRVANGYARNYLLPRGIAGKATKSALRQIESKKLLMQKEHAERVVVATAMAEKIAKLSITLTVRAGEDEKLYGSVTSSQIIEAVAKEGIELEKSCLKMSEPIKELGTFTIDVRLHSDVTGQLTVWVVRSTEE